jgi:hypothetical protein
METVFAILSDPNRIPAWLPGCRAVGGAALIHRGVWLDVRFDERTSSFQITDFHPPFSFAWVERGAREGSRTSFQLGFVAGTTAIRLQQVSILRASQERRNPKRQLDLTLQNLRKLALGST